MYKSKCRMSGTDHNICSKFSWWNSGAEIHLQIFRCENRGLEIQCMYKFRYKIVITYVGRNARYKVGIIDFKTSRYFARLWNEAWNLRFTDQNIGNAHIIYCHIRITGRHLSQIHLKIIYSDLYNPWFLVLKNDFLRALILGRN